MFLASPDAETAREGGALTRSVLTVPSLGKGCETPTDSDPTIVPPVGVARRPSVGRELNRPSFPERTGNESDGRIQPEVRFECGSAGPAET